MANIIMCEVQNRVCKSLTCMKSENADLLSKLAEAEWERDAEQAHNARLRIALERIVDLYHTPNALIKSVLHEAESALALTPSDSAARVQGMVNVLEFIIEYQHPAYLQGKAREALAAWREGRGE